MPYTVKGKCVYKKDGGSKVGCTTGSVKDYLAALHANANESLKETNKLVGGKSDNLTISDIAKKFNVSFDKIKSQIEKGKKVEMEHTKDIEKAIEIATDHVSEMPNYYDKLEKMEKKEINENKILIKRLLRENLEEGPFTRALGTAAMAASTLLPPNAQAQKPRENPKMEKSNDLEGTVKKEMNGSYTSTARGIAPKERFAYEMALTNAQDQILSKLGIEKGSLNIISVIRKKIVKNQNGTYTCIITISANIK